MQHFLTRARYWSALLGTLAAFALSGHAQAQVPVYDTSPVMYFDGVGAQGSLLTDGVALYGSSSAGGYAPGGLLYRLSIEPSSLGVLTTIHQFGRLDMWNGAIPGAGLLLASDGNLYGTTLLTSLDLIRGKIDPPGTIFRVSRAGLGYTNLFSFEPLTLDSRNYPVNTTGATQEPGGGAFFTQGSLIEGQENGVPYLYGTALTGGANGVGTIYKMQRDGGPTTFKTLASFGAFNLLPGTTIIDRNERGQYKNPDGAYPMERLVLGGDGYLYGVTRDGGANGTGVIFRVSVDGGLIEVLHTFGALVPGANARVTVACDVNNFNSDLDTNVDGGCPLGGMVLSGGMLYGTTAAMGPNGYGTVFSIARGGAGSAFTTLRAFNITDGAFPTGNLIVSSDGMLVGTTQGGGTLPTDQSTGQPVAGAAAGTVYKLSLDGATYSEQCVFNSVDGLLKGATPIGGVVQAADGNFFGTTTSGAYGYGLVYQCGAKYSGPLIGIRPFVDDDGGGSLPMWLLVVLTTVLGIRLAAQRRVLNR